MIDFSNINIDELTFNSFITPNRTLSFDENTKRKVDEFFFRDHTGIGKFSQDLSDFKKFAIKTDENVKLPSRHNDHLQSVELLRNYFNDVARFEGISDLFFNPNALVTGELDSDEQFLTALMHIKGIIYQLKTKTECFRKKNKPIFINFRVAPVTLWYMVLSSGIPSGLGETSSNINKKGDLEITYKMGWNISRIFYICNRAPVELETVLTNYCKKN